MFKLNLSFDKLDRLGTVNSNIKYLKKHDKALTTGQMITSGNDT